jgi:hypothetical protein
MDFATFSKDLLCHFNVNYVYFSRIHLLSKICVSGYDETKNVFQNNYSSESSEGDGVFENEVVVRMFVYEKEMNRRLEKIEE